jgi:hypothetical protein
MSLVVGVGWQGFTSSAKVGVVADSTLVASTSDVRSGWLAAAQGTITIDAVVNILRE